MSDEVENKGLVNGTQEPNVTCEESNTCVEIKPTTPVKIVTGTPPALKVAPKNRRKSRKNQGRGQAKKGILIYF